MEAKGPEGCFREIGPITQAAQVCLSLSAELAFRLDGPLPGTAPAPLGLERAQPARVSSMGLIWGQATSAVRSALLIPVGVYVRPTGSRREALTSKLVENRNALRCPPRVTLGDA